MAHEPIPVTDAEATVMEVLWQSSPRSSEDVVAAVAPATGWAEPTIKTLLNRLLNKGAISAEREGRRYLYSPVLSREARVEQQSEGLLGGAFQRARPAVGHRHRRAQAPGVAAGGGRGRWTLSWSCCCAPPWP